MGSGPELTTCTICGRQIINIPDATGAFVACDPGLRALSDNEEGGKGGTFLTIIAPEGHPTRPGTAYPGADVQGYRPHFYTCDSIDKAYEPAVLLDRLYNTGSPSVGPAVGGEGGGGELP